MTNPVLSIPFGKVDLGQVVATLGVTGLLVKDVVYKTFVQDSLKRFVNGDWGDIADCDKETDDRDLKLGLPLLGSYKALEPPIYIFRKGQQTMVILHNELQSEVL